MAHAHRGTYGGLRLHRVFLQSTPAPLGAPLSQSSTVRKENPQPDHRGLTVTCPRKRGNSTQSNYVRLWRDSQSARSGGDPTTTRSMRATGPAPKDSPALSWQLWNLVWQHQTDVVLERARL